MHSRLYLILSKDQANWFSDERLKLITKDANYRNFRAWNWRRSKQSALTLPVLSGKSEGQSIININWEMNCKETKCPSLMKNLRLEGLYGRIMKEVVSTDKVQAWFFCFALISHLLKLRWPMISSYNLSSYQATKLSGEDWMICI